MAEPLSTDLVTGGAGFIGSHLVDALLAQDRRVVVLDDLSSGRRDNLPTDAAGLEVVEGDIRDAKLLRRLGREHAFDRVLHLAAIASVARSVEDPVATHSVNVEGSLRLALWAAREVPTLRRFVFTSSAAVYGSDVPVPTPEDAHGTPYAPYGLEKATVERYLAWLHRSEGLPAVSARFFNIFGPRQDPSSPYSGVLSILARAAREGSTFTVHGDGEQTRDFVYVLDAVAALQLLAERDEATGGAVNVGTGRAVTLNEVVAAVRDVAGEGFVLSVEHGPSRPGDIRHSQADAGLLRGMGWRPRWSMGEGLAALLRSE
jgi:UDP-glucose 4-epimerase